jgi:hypothetical protein
MIIGIIGCPRVTLTFCVSWQVAIYGTKLTIKEQGSLSKISSGEGAFAKLEVC